MTVRILLDLIFRPIANFAHGLFGPYFQHEQMNAHCIFNKLTRVSMYDLAQYQAIGESNK